ncbi:acylphosphatase [Yunchengibacter salinarum]|uniref:acylphosphatase n=1 Tax=Yunchengibacter salinarum TaxID=3133399 RepID=UPI0035B57BE6
MLGTDTALKVRVSGRVQGVSFRDWTRREADRLGVNGWVRNREDGTVEALLVGRQDRVEDMLRALRSGPPGARVTRVTTEPARGVTPDRFEIKPTV